MQHLLTETELQDLVSAAEKAHQDNKALIQRLCTEVANHKPVKWGWGPPYDSTGVSLDEPRPWGCMLTVEEEWYCDKCPVKDVCPHDRKEYSQ